MTSDEIYEQLTSVFQEVFDDETIVVMAETTANDIENWDSFNNIGLMIAVEIRFGIRLTTIEIEGLRSAGDLAGLINTKLGK